jgi:ubiquinone/menaquinone biosynthesis C-methylase UbiE
MNINRWLWRIYPHVYDALLHSPLYQELLSQVIKSLHLEFPCKILDAGCGTGNLETAIYHSIYKDNVIIEAIDSSIYMLSIAGKKLPLTGRFRLMNLNAVLAYDGGIFDQVTMIHVFYALENPELTLREVYRVLRPQGTLVLANPRKGASIFRFIQKNLTYLRLDQRILFLIRMFFIVPINFLITNAGKSGYYHFLEQEDWSIILHKAGFTDISINLTYGDQDYMIIAKKGNKRE